MKKIISTVCVIVMLLTSVSCGIIEKDQQLGIQTSVQTTEQSNTEAMLDTTDKKNEVVVFADESLVFALSDIKEQYESINPNTIITLNFASSRSLLDQILSGDKCDIFISESQKDMDRLDYSKDEKSNPSKNDYVLLDTRTDLVENKAVLAVPVNNPKGIDSFSDLITEKLSLLAIVEDNVQIGISSREILENIGKPVDRFEEEGKVLSVSSVKDVIQQVEDGNVDAGIIYDTDALSSSVQVVEMANEKICSRIIYPVAVLKISKNEIEARKLLEYLKNEDATRIFTLYGFTRIN